MKNVIYPLIAIVLLLTSAKLALPVQDYKVTDGYSVKFESKDPSGIFEKLKGDVSFDKDNLSSSHMNFEIDVASISMGNGMKNKKSMTAEWFDQANYPKITFVSTKMEKSDNGYYVMGNLTMKGTKRYRKIPFDVSNTSNGLKLTGSFWEERSYYKIGKSKGDVPDKLKITFSIPISKK
jgi:polyisoprenoid-binding protein YceI